MDRPTPGPHMLPQPQVPPGGRFLDVDGIRTFYLREGAGPPVLLIHGGSPGACAQITWKLNIRPLAAAGFAVFAYDQPGFGHTAPPPDDSVEYRIRHAGAFVAALGLEGAHLIGNSVGAYVAARLALQDPQIRRLVLVGSGMLAPTGSEAAAAQARRHAEELREFVPTRANVRTLTSWTLFHPALVTEDLVEERLAMSSGPLAEAHRRRGSAPAPPPLGEELRQITARTLLLWGRDDRGAAVERALLLLQAIPGAELHIFDRCGHWVQWDQADRFNRIVADFLREPA